MKLVRALVLLVVGFIWVGGCSTPVINLLYRTEAIPDDYRYGDLYRLSNLKQFKDPKTDCPAFAAPKVKRSKKVALYIIGDSFTEPQRIDSADFAVDRYQYAHWGTLLHLRLDTAYTNIVLLESVERNVREHFMVPISNLVPDTATFVTVPEDTRFISWLDRLFSSDPTEDRLNTLLFQFDPMLALKEWKSTLNHRFFDRTDPKVTVSEDGGTIAYHVDTDTTLINSSFTFIPTSDIDSLVRVIEENQRYLLQLGFDQVWLSIIPNKASVLMPEYGTYNHLLDRIDRHRDLTVPTINVLQAFQTMKQNPYLKGDSHWSCAGQHHWLDRVNRKMLSPENLHN
ncbi:hypothetical protein [Salmonirosea aquatica]|uniref:AlgX/AlgJ SGNH hydrolase-like domain-containing protein n=1 Tax=Salmonirosea aquatica TaxID=2654236 RepID=A0A7C9G001_9BACT|nr:hypothetical protein [Cytophagaceae bacterium SJW1-29]